MESNFLMETSSNTNKKPNSPKLYGTKTYPVNISIEDRNSHLGRFSLEIYPTMSLKFLKLQVEQEYGFPASSQKWIFCNSLAENNNLTMHEYGVVPNSTLFLYLDIKKENHTKKLFKSEACHNIERDILSMKNCGERKLLKEVFKTKQNCKEAQNESCEFPVIKTNSVSNKKGNHDLKSDSGANQNVETDICKLFDASLNKINDNLFNKNTSQKKFDSFKKYDNMCDKEDFDLRVAVSKDSDNIEEFNTDNRMHCNIQNDMRKVETNIINKGISSMENYNQYTGKIPIDEINNDCFNKYGTFNSSVMCSKFGGLLKTEIPEQKCEEDYSDQVYFNKAVTNKVEPKTVPVPEDKTHYLFKQSTFKEDTIDKTKNICENLDEKMLLRKPDEKYCIEKKSAQNYQFWVEIDKLNLVHNTNDFICPICFCEVATGKGVILHECLHMFCIGCLHKTVEYAEEALIKCPFRDESYSCQSHLQQREIKSLVSIDVYERYLQRSITTAESLAEKSFHCKTPDCKGWCIVDKNLNIFHCPVCLHFNCLYCKAIHEGLNCRNYQAKLKKQELLHQDSDKTLALLNKMIEEGKMMKCPKCDLFLMKRWGCDWLKCSVCQTEICWITKGPRWGPNGQGDTSAGCKCGVNGIKCHPSCTYCH